MQLDVFVGKVIVVEADGALSKFLFHTGAPFPAHSCPSSQSVVLGQIVFNPQLPQKTVSPPAPLKVKGLQT